MGITVRQVMKYLSEYPDEAKLGVMVADTKNRKKYQIKEGIIKSAYAITARNADRDSTGKRWNWMKLKNMRRSEDTEQIHVCNWAAWNENRYPELKWLQHIPNGGSRNKAEAVKLKSMGVKSGVPDLHLPYAKGVYIGLYIEMKYGTGRHQDS